MHAYNVGFTRKLKRGRPFKFKQHDSVSCLQEKKKELFERYEMQKEAMNLISLAYNFGKLTKEEYDVACFLEHLCIKMQKSLGIKRIPSSSPNTWNSAIKSSWMMINMDDANDKAQQYWKKIKDFVNMQNPRIANEFFNIIAAHHTYEELQAVKFNFSVTDILKAGVQIVQKMFDLNYL
jgi:hypothetical protein